MTDTYRVLWRTFEAVHKVTYAAYALLPSGEEPYVVGGALPEQDHGTCIETVRRVIVAQTGHADVYLLDNPVVTTAASQQVRRLTLTRDASGQVAARLDVLNRDLSPIVSRDVLLTDDHSKNAKILRASRLQIWHLLTRWGTQGLPEASQLGFDVRVSDDALIHYVPGQHLQLVKP